MRLRAGALRPEKEGCIFINLVVLFLAFLSCLLVTTKNASTGVFDTHYTSTKQRPDFSISRRIFIYYTTPSNKYLRDPSLILWGRRGRGGFSHSDFFMISGQIYCFFLTRGKGGHIYSFLVWLHMWMIPYFNGKLPAFFDFITPNLNSVNWIKRV